MLCRKCRKEIPADSVYCNYCGTNQTLSHKPKSRGNGQGSVYQLPNKRWRVQVTLGYNLDENGTKHRKCHTKEGFKTKKEALDYLATFDKTQTRPQDIKISELWQAIDKRDLSNLSDGRKGMYKTAYNRISPLHHRNISSLTLTELQDFIDSLELGPNPLKDIKNLLSKMYEYAMIDDYAKKNIARYLDIPKPGAPAERATFSDFEIKKLWSGWHEGNRAAGCILIMLHCGLRTGELLQIRPENVHLDRHVMYGGIKTEKGKSRPLVITDSIAPIVKYFLSEGNTTLTGYRKKDFYSDYSKMRIELGLREELVPYCARHTCATRLSNANLPPSVIIDILGHDKYDTTLNYTHNYIDTMKNALEKIV